MSWEEQETSLEQTTQEIISAWEEIIAFEPDEGIGDP
jgi:hypothetical protein